MGTFQSLLTELEDCGKYVDDTGNRNIEKNLNDNLKLLREAIFSNAADIKTPLGYEAYGDETLQELHDDAESAFQEYGEAQSRLEKNIHDSKKSESKADKDAVRALRAAVKATKTAYSIKFRAYQSKLQQQRENDQMGDNDTLMSASALAKVERANGLKGRGLQGAGVVPLEGVERKGRTYNLNDIQGKATPSAYVYRKLGSKFIRLPDLDKRTLTIVQPNRRKVGPMREISDSLQTMIKDLVFRNDISQEKYDHLSIDDKKLFKEILEMTHLQYNFDQHLEDPLESLRMEYDKLKGELMLGNTNPSILKQLKVSLDEVKVCDPNKVIAMLVLDPRNISKSGGLYNLNADHNLTELKSIMKDLLVKEVPSRNRPTVWATDSKPYSKKTVSTQTDASGEQWEKHSDTSGSGVWAYKKRSEALRHSLCN
ncbi:hypothetical protein ON010_g5114 [Phytophthora cinnamomi]|nr:hypothetical protein ON010_g5114 [Phytophthora cinnamomi]